MPLSSISLYRLLPSSPRTLTLVPSSEQEPPNLKRQSLSFPPVTHQWCGGHVTERNTLPVMEPVDGKPLGSPRVYKHDLLQVIARSKYFVVARRLVRERRIELRIALPGWLFFLWCGSSSHAVFFCGGGLVVVVGQVRPRELGDRETAMCHLLVMTCLSY